jgi:hypothetical protein
MWITLFAIAAAAAMCLGVAAVMGSEKEEETQRGRP